MCLANLCKYVALKCHWLNGFNEGFHGISFFLAIYSNNIFYNDNIIIKDEKCKQLLLLLLVVYRIKSTKPKQVSSSFSISFS